MIERVARNGRVFISADGEHFEPLGELKEVELSLNPCNPSPEKEYRSYLSKECTLTLEGEIEYGSRLFLRTGKKLFLRCPKKIRRSRKWRKYKNI
jgi:hypothetical protein